MILGGIKQSLPWVIREDSSEELSKNLSEMEGAKQASAEGASYGKDESSSNIPESEQSWGVGWKPRSPQWLEWNKKGETW